ncbi:MAG: prepilin-type N-terminal cleavage/methylation domain-containing protein [Pseudomonadota bacterium]
MFYKNKTTIRKDYQSGFSITEVMIGVAVFSSLLILVAQSFSSSALLSSTIDHKKAAVEVANSYLDRVIYWLAQPKDFNHFQVMPAKILDPPPLDPLTGSPLTYSRKLDGIVDAAEFGFPPEFLTDKPYIKKVEVLIIAPCINGVYDCQKITTKVTYNDLSGNEKQPIEYTTAMFRIPDSS